MANRRVRPPTISDKLTDPLGVLTPKTVKAAINYERRLKERREHVLIGVKKASKALSDNLKPHAEPEPEPVPSEESADEEPEKAEPEVNKCICIPETKRVLDLL